MNGENLIMNDDLIFRLKERARIRRQISTRKSVQEGKPDRISDLLEEAAERIEKIEYEEKETNQRRCGPDGCQWCKSFIQILCCPCYLIAFLFTFINFFIMYFYIQNIRFLLSKSSTHFFLLKNYFFVF